LVIGLWALVSSGASGHWNDYMSYVLSVGISKDSSQPGLWKRAILFGLKGLKNECYNNVRRAAQVSFLKTVKSG
jgi:hypothetical protein